MIDVLDSLEEIQTEHKNLLNIALNKKISKAEPGSRKTATALPALPFRPSDKLNVDLSKGHAEYLKEKGYLDETGKPTEKYYTQIKSSVQPFKGNLTSKDLSILKNVNLKGENWEEFIKSKSSSYLYERCISLKKANYFDDTGRVNDFVKNLLENEKEKYIKSKFSSHHVSLINIIVENNNKINEEIYNKYGFKTEWTNQVNKLNWMIENKILTDNFQLTDFGKNLRFSKIKPILLDEINERDLKIIKWLQTNEDKDLGLISIKSAFSRIYRFQSAGLIGENLKISDKLNSILKIKETEFKNDHRPTWVKENRRPRFDDLSEKELNLIKTLALEVPFLSESQIKNRFSMTLDELKNLNQGILNVKNIFVQGKNINCYALNWNTKEILKPAGIQRSLKGRFQKDSHVYHDLMVYESIQHTKELMLINENEVCEIIHERSQFQAKVSANDNKGMCHADAVVRDKSGGETAVEYGKYSVSRMMQKINGFSQDNVMVYSDSQTMIHSYKNTYTNMVQNNKLKSKSVQFIYLPSIHL